LTRKISGIAATQCLMVRRIAAPLTSPALLQVKLGIRDGAPADKFGPQVEDVVADQLSRLPRLIDDFIAGKITIY
jgi:S-adenosylmethionine synthetase